MHYKFDTIIIGSGPGGYTAAIRSAQLGKKVAIIEKYSVLGGTCTNVGCIPSKALLDSSEQYHIAATKFDEFGISVGDVSLNFTQFIQRKDEVVIANNKGLEYLMRKNKIQVFEGTGTFISSNKISVAGNTENWQLQFDNAIIATGSKPATLPNIIIDKKRIISSTEALSLKERPKSIAIIGGGVIGVELASIYARIGTKVTLLEYAKTLLPLMDTELGKALARKLKKENIKIHVNAMVTNAKNHNDFTKVTFKNAKGETEEITADYTLMAVGRIPYTKALRLEKAGVRIDEKGFIIVNEKLQTNVSNIYALGDVIGGAMLAHKAEDEGSFVAEIIDGQKPSLHHELIPSVVYTWPEVASVGRTEQELKNNNIPYKKGKVPISALGRARAASEKDGFIKILSDPKYGEVLGVHMFSPRAADMISTAVTALQYEVTDVDMTNVSYPHPSYTEAIKEAFLDVSGKGTISL